MEPTATAVAAEPATVKRNGDDAASVPEPAEDDAVERWKKPCQSLSVNPGSLE